MALRRIPLRKLILAAVLLCSVFCFCLILFASLVAVLREAAPGGRGAGGSRSPVAILEHVIAHHIPFFAHHSHHR
jgi:hypothetical protein